MLQKAGKRFMCTRRSVATDFCNKRFLRVIIGIWLDFDKTPSFGMQTDESGAQKTWTVFNLKQNNNSRRSNDLRRMNRPYIISVFELHGRHSNSRWNWFVIQLCSATMVPRHWQLMHNGRSEQNNVEKGKWRRHNLDFEKCHGPKRSNCDLGAALVLPAESEQSVRMENDDKKCRWFHIWKPCVVCGFSCMLWFDGQLHRSQAAGELFTYKGIWYCRLVMDRCRAPSLCEFWRRHGSSWIERYPCIDLMMNDYLWNYYRSGRTVKNIIMEEYSTTNNRTYTYIVYLSLIGQEVGQVACRYKIIKGALWAYLRILDKITQGRETLPYRVSWLPHLKYLPLIVYLATYQPPIPASTYPPFTNKCI